MRLRLCALAILSATTAHAVPIQWSTTAGGNDHYYELVTTLQSWDSARADALSRVHAGLAGYLVNITSSAENQFLLNTFSPGNFGGLWTGGNDVANVNNFVWADGPEAGQAFVYNGFYPGEPNGGTVENYVEIGFFGTFWNDRIGSQPWGYIVEYGGVAAAIVPLSSSALFLLGGLGLMAAQARRK